MRRLLTSIISLMLLAAFIAIQGCAEKEGTKRPPTRRRAQPAKPTAPKADTSKADPPAGGNYASSAADPTITGVPGSPERHDDDRRQAAPAAAAEVRRQDRAQRRAVEAVLAAARRAAQGRAERAADHDRRCRLRRPSTFGGVIPTPALDRIAANGLRYTNFHSTALCSPTRAALITGRNHHSVGFGVVSEQATGYPGLQQHHRPRTRRRSAGSCKDNGYRTSWFGKNHNTPTFQASQAGPFDQWPIGMGFEYFYGFIGGDTSQWQPNLFRNTTPIYPLRRQPGLEPDHRHGRRGHRLHEPASTTLDPGASRSSSTTCPAARTRRTIRRRSGSRRSATCTCSTRAGTRCASRSSPTRRSSA